MKTSLFLLCFFAIFQAKHVLVSARAVQTINELDEDEQACVSELRLDENKIKRINSQDITPETDRDFNNFLGCSWQKAGLLESNGQINYELLKDALRELMDEELRGESPAVKRLVHQMLTGVINECENESPRGRTHGQTAVKVQNCIMSKLNNLMED